MNLGCLTHEEVEFLFQHLPFPVRHRWGGDAIEFVQGLRAHMKQEAAARQVVGRNGMTLQDARDLNAAPPQPITPTQQGVPTQDRSAM